MSFITEESGICLSHSGEVQYPICGELIREGELKYILEEGGKVLLTDTPCGSAIQEFDCRFDRKVVDSGKFITLTNVCTLPITVTGFMMEDAARFSLFEYPLHKGKGLYTTGNTPDLPFTLQPNEFKRINTYFHPLISELTNGTPGTFDNRIGDSFSSKVDIFPGFPIVNCSDDPNSCDAFFTLSGEFICEEPDKDWMYNDENFITPNLSDLGGVASDYCIPITDPIEMVKDGGLHIQNTFSGLRDTAIAYGKVLDDGGRLHEKYQDIGMAGSLAGFGAICQGLIDSNNHNNINNLFGATLTNHSYTYNDGENEYPLNISYTPNNTAVKSFNDIPHTGMIFDVLSEDSSRETYYSTVFINVGRQDANTQLNRMFTAQKGEYTLEDFCTPEEFKSTNNPLVEFTSFIGGSPTNLGAPPIDLNSMVYPYPFFRTYVGKTDGKLYNFSSRTVGMLGKGAYSDINMLFTGMVSYAGPNPQVILMGQEVVSMYIAKNAKLTIYSKKDLNGDIIFEGVGPKYYYIDTSQITSNTRSDYMAFNADINQLDENSFVNSDLLDGNGSFIENALNPLALGPGFQEPSPGSFRLPYSSDTFFGRHGDGSFKIEYLA